jgi:hypothetical protein
MIVLTKIHLTMGMLVLASLENNRQTTCNEYMTHHYTSCDTNHNLCWKVHSKHGPS